MSTITAIINLFVEYRKVARRQAPDALQVIQSLNKPEFELSDVYAHAAALAKLHPHNAHIHDKIRQQLQVLRDLGRLEFLGRGRYRLP